MDDGAHSSGGTQLVIWLVLTLFFGGVGYAIGSKKGKGALGFILGAVLGVIGWIILAFIPGDTVVRAKPKRLGRRGPGPARTGTRIVGGRPPVRRRL